MNLDSYPPKGKWKIFSAIEYTPKAGGKRLRSRIFEVASLDLGIDPMEDVSVAIEFFHSGTLIHDDLPEIDDARMRRGKKANHLAFGQGLAVLAGDGLFFLAFKLLSNHPKLFKEFSKVAFEVLLGEAMDVEMEDVDDVSTKDIIEMYEKKTGALFGFSFSAPALEVEDPRFERLKKLGRDFGIAFQIYDDLKDLTSKPEIIGKDTGKDVRKKTLVKSWGVERARDTADEIYSKVLKELSELEMTNLVGFLESVKDSVRSR